MEPRERCVAACSRVVRSHHAQAFVDTADHLVPKSVGEGAQDVAEAVDSITLREDEVHGHVDTELLDDFLDTLAKAACVFAKLALFDHVREPARDQLINALARFHATVAPLAAVEIGTP